MGFILERMGLWIDLAEAQEAVLHCSGNGIRIAVLDSGIEFDHPDLAGLKCADDMQIIETELRPEIKPGGGIDVYGHGTAIAGIIHRLAPEAEIGSFRVLDAYNLSKTDIIREGAQQALARNYHILNCSFGCGLPDHIHRYKSWVDQAYVMGVHVVSACSNDDFRKPEWPGAFASVITVDFRQLAAEDLYYRPGNLVEFVANGDRVEVPWRNKGRKLKSGSSFAAPHATAFLARVLSAFPLLPPLQAKALLHQLAKPWTEDCEANQPR